MIRLSCVFRAGPWFLITMIIPVLKVMVFPCLRNSYAIDHSLGAFEINSLTPGQRSALPLVNLSTRSCWLDSRVILITPVVRTLEPRSLLAGGTRAGGVDIWSGIYYHLLMLMWVHSFVTYVLIGIVLSHLWSNNTIM